MVTRVSLFGGEPVDLWRNGRMEHRHRDRPDNWRRPTIEPTGLAHNGFHVEHEHRFQDIYDRIRRESQTGSGGARHRLSADDRPPDPHPASYGRHARPTNRTSPPR
jgi:hypothetical protein